MSRSLLTITILLLWWAARSAQAAEHWAFQPVREVTPPATGVLQETGGDGSRWCINPIDRFILKALSSHRLQPAPAASGVELIRRANLDLIGLPPAPAEIDEFVNDPAPNAWEKLIDRLLASPHYGERWGRHWLDLVRFGETDGFEHDAVRSNAWRYRDYVVRAFNADKPYDRFIREQIAGDELYPGDADALVATAFALLGPDMVDSSDQIQRRHNTLNDMTDTTGLAFLGLTMGCARCHDHKFEPLTQRDYYSLQAFFTSSEFRRDVPVATAAERARHETAMREYTRATRALRREINRIEAPYREKLHERRFAALSPEAQLAHQTSRDKRTTEQANLVHETMAALKITDAEILEAMPEADRETCRRLQAEIAAVVKPLSLPTTMALQDSNSPPARTFVLRRGDYTNPGEEVEPCFPVILDRGSSGKPAPGARRALAEWLTNPGNPLTARVMVNRIWQHHFGRGIVPTPSDFGTHGQPPTHPELLDWLANEFVRRGWSLKRLHKLILLSATYQQSSRPTARTLSQDAENEWFSRQNRVRLEGEVIRDSLLAISGRLNRAMGGPGVFPPIPADLFKGARGWNVNPDPAAHNRRSIYIFNRRNLRFPFLEVFDAPDSNLSCPIRGTSTSAPQSLTLLNSEAVLAASRATAERIVARAKSPSDQVESAYRLILGRPPTDAEATLSREFLRESPLPEFCRALFNLNGFVYAN